MPDLRLAAVNLTQHPVAVYDGQRIVASFPPSGEQARLREHVAPGPALRVDGVDVPCRFVSYEDVVDGLPPPRQGMVFVVSRVLAAAVDRPDLYFPHQEVRGADGRIVGCRGLGQFRTFPDA